MNLNKKKLLFLIFLQLTLVSLSAEDSKYYIIEFPEYENIDESGFIPDNKLQILKIVQNEIYKIFFQYTSGNVSAAPVKITQSVKQTHIIKTVLRLNTLIKSEKEGFFCESELELAIIPSEKDDQNIIVRYTGYGKNESEAFLNSVSKLPEQFKYRYSDFEEKSGFYRILDIYQNEIIVNCGKKDGFAKGDYLDILNSQNGKVEGRIILTDSDNEIAYGKLLNYSSFDKKELSALIEFSADGKNHKPSVGARVKKINYLGLESSVSPLFFIDDLFSGIAYNIKFEYFRKLYIFHPFITAGLFNLESEYENYDLALYSAGIAMIRHLGRLSLRSEASISGGWYRKESSSASDFRGGAVKGGLSYSIARHFAVFTEAGFMQLFAEDPADSDIGGFIFGGGLSFKY